MKEAGAGCFSLLTSALPCDGFVFLIRRNMSAFSDEPVLVSPAPVRRWGRRQWMLVAAVAVVLAIVGTIIATPFYQKHLEEKAAHVKRGELYGAIYDTTIEGVVSTVELGWPGEHLAVIVRPSPVTGAVMEIAGPFGAERLTWNAERSAFGPTKATINPLEHRKVKLTLRRDGREIWSARLWAWGVAPEGHAH